MNRNKIKKYLKMFLIFAPIAYILWLISPLEFIGNGSGMILFCLFTLVYSICILVFLNLIFFKEEEEVINSLASTTKVLRIIFNALFIIGLLLFIFISIIAISLSGRYYEKTIFVFKHNPEVKIIQRGSNGGAWDSDYPVYREIKVTPMLHYFRIIQDIDTNRIDRNDWQRIE